MGPTGEGLSSTRLPPHPHPPTSPPTTALQMSPELLTGYKIRGSNDPLLRFHEFARVAPGTRRNILLGRSLAYYKKFIVTQEEPDEGDA